MLIKSSRKILKKWDRPVGCHCFPMWWVRSPYSGVFQRSMGFLAGYVPTLAGATWVSPHQYPSFPQSSLQPLLIVPQDWINLVPETRGLVQHSKLSPSSQDKGHPSTELWIRSFLQTQFSLTLISCIHEYPRTTTLWEDKYEPILEDPQQTTYLLCIKVTQKRLNILFSKQLLFPQSYGYYHEGKQALRMKNKIKQY